MLLPTFAWAQINLNSGGQIGINTSPISSNQLRVIASSEHTAIYGKSTSSGAARYGVRGEASNGYDSYAFYGTASGADYNYGLRVSVQPGTFNSWGVYSTSSGGYGGYFSGTAAGLYVSGGIYQPSDEKLKTNIREMDRTDIASKLQTLRPLQYEFLDNETLRSRGLPTTHAVEGEHMGLSAQQVADVFPEIVRDIVHVLDEGQSPEERTGEPFQTVTTKAINYDELTVLLLAAVQELQAEVKALKTQLNEER